MLCAASLSTLAWYNGIPGCDGECLTYENDGVCNVPGPCPAGTDCADCQTIYPAFEIASACLSATAMLLFLCVACYYQQKWARFDRYKRTSSNLQV